MARVKAQNDPWSPLPEKTMGISHPPCDPRHQLIDSDRYIESLERKLKRLKGRNKPEPSSRDIIDSLAGFKDDQMRRFLDNGHALDTQSSSMVIAEDATSSSSTSYLQRRLHPERQALNMEELFELLKDDELARNRPEDEDGGEPPHAPETESTGRSKSPENNVDKPGSGDEKTNSSTGEKKGAGGVPENDVDDERVKHTESERNANKQNEDTVERDGGKDES